MSLFSQGPVDFSVSKRLLYKKRKFFYNALLYYHTQITKNHILKDTSIHFNELKFQKEATTPCKLTIANYFFSSLYFLIPGTDWRTGLGLVRETPLEKTENHLIAGIMDQNLEVPQMCSQFITWDFLTVNQKAGGPGPGRQKNVQGV